jgi:hypothetical protein
LRSVRDVRDVRGVRGVRDVRDERGVMRVSIHTFINGSLITRIYCSKSRYNTR